jgi:hypothetical protein
MGAPSVHPLRPDVGGEVPAFLGKNFAMPGSVAVSKGDCATECTTMTILNS